jgi:SAM-dependent methyltransferase
VDIAPDGSPIDLYLLLPERGEGELVAAAVRSGGSILELGCGVGRMTQQLVERGFRVTAVDESSAMLEHIRDAQVVHARIEELDLGRRFDAALLASNLLSVAPEQRRAFLETCVRHADVAVIETLPIGWEPRLDPVDIGSVTALTRVDRFANGVAYGSVEYQREGRNWRHEFAMRVFADEDELAAALGEAGLCVDRWLDRKRGWFVATTG